MSVWLCSRTDCPFEELTNDLCDVECELCSLLEGKRYTIPTERSGANSTSNG